MATTTHGFRWVLWRPGSLSSVACACGWERQDATPERCIAAFAKHTRVKAPKTDLVMTATQAGLFD